MGRKRSQRNPDPSGLTDEPPGSAERSIPDHPTDHASADVSPHSPQRETQAAKPHPPDPAEPGETNDAPNTASGGRKRKRRRRKKTPGASAPALPGEVGSTEAPMDSTASAAAEASAAEDDPANADPAEHSGQASGGGRKRRRRRKKRPGSGAHAAGAAPTAAAPPEAGRRPTAADERAAEEDLGEAAASPAAAASTEADPPVGFKVCLYCGETKPLGDFLRRTGKRSGGESRRGACRDCRKRRRAAALAADGEAADPLPPSAVAQPPVVLEGEDAAGEAAPKRRIRRPMPEPPASALLEPTREAELRPTRQGTIRMRGRTDKGRRWQQETDLEMARCLVREHAAVVVNRFTIRRLYTNRSFRRYILERDQYTCHFCGEYGDTIDHLLPRAKGGHTTPINCVCACMLCNQNKADRDLDEFMEEAEDPESAEEAVPEASTDQPPSTIKET